MKKANFLAIAIVASMVVIAGCKKDDGPDDANNCLLTRVNDDGEIKTIEYDSQGRVTKVTYSEDDGESDGYTTYTYSNNQVVVKDIDDEDTYTETFTLVNGRVSTSTETYTSERGDDYIYTTVKNSTYTHNGDGQLTKESSTRTTTSNKPNFETEVETIEFVNTYQNGNLVLSVETVTYSATNGRDAQTYIYTTAYEYYLDKNNTLFEEAPFITKPNKNLVKKRTESSVQNGQAGSTYSANYTYEFDANSLVTKSVQSHSDSSNSDDTTTYQYNCN